MGLIKYYNKEKEAWEIVSASDAANISLHNEVLQDKDEGTISTARAFQKINNKISKLEHHLAWIYLNGAKGGSGGGSGGSGTTYTITINDGKTTFYTSTDSITLSLTINSGTTKKTFYVNAINMSNGKMLVDGESHTSMTPFNFTIPNLPSTTNNIYLQAYDSQDNYTELVEITVNVGSFSIGQTVYPSSIYTVGGNNNTSIGFTIQNKTGNVAYLLTYKSRLADPLTEVIDKTVENKFGAEYMTVVSSSSSIQLYSVELNDDLKTTDFGTTVTYKTILYSPELGFTSNYFTNQITVSSGDQLSVILYDIGQSSDEVDQYQFQQNNYCTFKVLLYYEKLDVTQFYYKYTIYKGEEIVYTSDVSTMYSATSGSSNINCSTSGFELGTDYRLIFEACDTEDFTGEKYDSAEGYFSIIEGVSGILQDYKGNLISRFSSFNFPDETASEWTYTIPSSGDYAFTAWPSGVINGTTLKLHNNTSSTGFKTNNYRYINLTGNTYATIDEFKTLFPNSNNLQSSLFYPGFYLQITYEWAVENPVDQTILSFGEYGSNGEFQGFDISSDYIKIGFGSSVTQFESPLKAENHYPSTSTKKTRTITVGLNVWRGETTTSTSKQTTYYFALYIDGTMTKCVLVPESTLTTTTTGWKFGAPLYLGCKNDLSNQANCYIYDFKLYAQNQPDLSLVWNFMSAIEQAHLTTGGIVDDELDVSLRNKNLFNKSSNTCLICDTESGNYLEPAVMYSRLSSSYNDADLNYPIVYIEETQTSSDMYQCIKATWTPSDTLNGVLITKKTWPVKVTITTKYGSDIVIESDSTELAPKIAIQGTSSLSYNSKNLELYVGSVTVDKPKLLKINGWLPENEYTLKSDVVDSAHVNNVAIGSFVNNTTFIDHYEGSGYSADNNIGKKIKKTSEGFPCLVFVKYANGTTEFSGIYNFNLGRYAYFNLGLKKLTSYTQEDKSDYAPQIITDYTYEEPDNVFSMEVNDNFGNAEELFTQADDTISEYIVDCRYAPANQSETQAYSTITKTLFTTLATATEKKVEKKRRTTDGKYETILEDNAIQYWLGGSTQMDEVTVEKSLNLEVARKYLVLALVFGMVDSVCKNMVFRTWDGIKWVQAFYDMDSAFKKDNGGSSSVKYNAHYNCFYNTENPYSDSKNSYIEGVLQFPREAEAQVKDPNWKYVYAGMCSTDGTPNRIWSLINTFDSRVLQESSHNKTIPDYYWYLRNNYITDPDKFIDEYFADYVNKSGSIMYNYDYKQKYVSYNQKWDATTNTLVSDTSGAQTSFLDGTRIAEVRAWFKKRIKFLDSVYATYNSGAALSSSYLNDVWDSRQKATSTSLSIKISADQKCKIGYNVSSGSKRFFWVDEDLKSYTVEAQSEGNLWYLYGGSVITAIPEFNKFGWQIFQKAFPFELIKELNLSGLTIEKFNSANDMKNLTNLTILDMSGLQYSDDTTLTIQLENNNNLQEFYLNKSNISTFTLPTGGSLKILDLTDNTKIASIPTQTVNGQSQSCLKGQSGLTTLRLKGTTIVDLYKATNGPDNSLSDLPSLSELTLPSSLQKLTINNCGLSDFSLTWSASNKTSPLTHVQIINCKNLKSIDLSGQNNLQCVEIYNCPNLTRINLSQTNEPTSSFNLTWTELTKLQSVNISNTDYIYELNLENAPDLNDIQAQSSQIQSVYCTDNEDNPIELQSSAFKNCSQLQTLMGNFSLYGSSIFENCSSLDFDNLLNNKKLKLSFAAVSSFEKCFYGCSLLGNGTNWPRTFIHQLNQSVGSIKEMFANTGSNFALDADIFAISEDDTTYKDLYVTDISGVFQNTQVHGNFYSEYEEDGVKHGFFAHMPQLKTAESAFAGNNTTMRYIDNNFFNNDVANKLTNVDYFFSGNKITAVDNTNSTNSIEQALESKDFFIRLKNCKHPPSKSEGENQSVANPDYPYPFGVFGGTGIWMNVTLDDQGHPYLFHLADKVDTQVVLNNNLYLGIKLILDPELCNYSYLFGGTQHTVGEYYIPTFSTIKSPFTYSEKLQLDLSKINGEEFFDKALKIVNNPFSGMVVTNSSTIPSTIFKGACNVEQLPNFFAGLALDNTSGEVFDFNTNKIFEECTSLKNISGIFSGCSEFRMRLAENMFENCQLINVSTAFANSRVIENIPSGLFKMASATITDMTNVFSGCYNLGYCDDYEYSTAEIYIDSGTRNLTWSDHVVAKGTKIEEYKIPTDLFDYCAANADVSYVLGQFWWEVHTIDTEGDIAVYNSSTDNWFGPSNKWSCINEFFKENTEFAKSTKLQYVFANTRFEEPDITDTSSFERVNLYPDMLFKNMQNLEDITGMFYNTEIPGRYKINQDLFKIGTSIETVTGSDGTTSDVTVTKYLPLKVMSNLWGNCKFNWKLSSGSGDKDTGSPQIEWNMFDGLDKLTDISYMFAGQQSKEYGLHQINLKMFEEFKNNDDATKSLNIAYLFAYSSLVSSVESSAPLFSQCNLTSSKTTYLTGISPGQLTNAGSVRSAGLAPNTDEWNENETE